MRHEFSEIKRYELKYTISEELAHLIRDHIRHICKLDRHVPHGEIGYIVNNLYFDTPDLKFYYDTKFRKPIRYKARARFYGNQAKDYIFPEIKYRNANVIWKRRHPIAIECWPDLFHPEKAMRTQTLVKEQLDTFEDIIYWHGAQSILHVRYFREPYVTELDDYGRITFDRQLACRLTNGSIELAYNENDLYYYDDPVNTKDDDSAVILEIKVQTLIPEWAIALINKFNLQQRGFSKYCYGIDSTMGIAEEGRNSKFAIS